jgi:hypothetical protein
MRLINPILLHGVGCTHDIPLEGFSAVESDRLLVIISP